MPANRAHRGVKAPPSVAQSLRFAAETLSRRLFSAAILAAILCAAPIEVPFAQSSVRDPGNDWEREWTVLAMAPDGAWGVATDPEVTTAITRAVGKCQSMSGRLLGCGAYLTTIRAGWSLGIRCGDSNIVIAEFDLADAEFSADLREYEMRNRLNRNMPPCIRAVTVDPSGEVVAPDSITPESIAPRRSSR